MKNRNDLSFGFSSVFEEGIDEIASRRKITFERTFTREDVVLFTEVSKDEQGRFAVQGLLTSTLPTKIGGDYNVLARQQKDIPSITRNVLSTKL